MRRDVHAGARRSRSWRTFWSQRRGLEKKVDHARPGRQFLDKAGLCGIPPSPRLWDFLKATLPGAYVKRLRQGDDRPGSRRRSSSTPTPCCGRTLDTAKATYGWLAGSSGPCSFVEAAGSFGPHILDLGCGIGDPYLLLRLAEPAERRHDGVDRSAEGIAPGP